MARFYSHIRMQEGFDPNYEGIEIRSGDGVAVAVSIARRMVSELLANHEPIDEMIFEIADATEALVAELPFHCCAQLQ
ncbi:DUF6894 family protein [Rhizobium grahamii]|uniref:DUF6894 domain-containing protein n=2 Tax=Rhizobium grahamii TaxID=1120045 RepID=S3HE37_9HYPH|nr:hypothetical protein [Rhizobium grahamii]EPE96320.1 hypothetical protein RGCCGE502_20635 [Rhizobium grahamii CCGE 502]RDJ02908.1 hypothetical protein B5K06_30815 [Rhizobium grahamii]